MTSFEQGFLQKCAEMGVPSDMAGRMLKTALQHRVSSGETLGGIAGMYGVPMSSIMSENGISDPSRIRAGSTLDIPSRVDVARELPSEEGSLVRRVPQKTNPRVVSPGPGENGLVDWQSNLAGQFLLNETGTNSVNGAYAPRGMASRAEKVDAGVPYGIPHVINLDGTLFPCFEDANGNLQIDYDEIARQWNEADRRETYENGRQMAIDNVADFTKEHEGFRDSAYYDSVGKKWSIGYGQTEIDGRRVRPGDRITREAAEDWMQDRMRRNYDALWSGMPRFYSMGTDPASSFLDLTYNGGPGIVEPDHVMYRQLSDPEGHPDPARVVYDNIARYHKADKKPSQVLLDRRNDAKATFFPQFTDGGAFNLTTVR